MASSVIHMAVASEINKIIKRKTVEEEEKENGENRLKSLSIKPKEYDFSGFSKNYEEQFLKAIKEQYHNSYDVYFDKTQ